MPPGKNDGSAYYFLVTAEHMTGLSELAYIYVGGEDWEFIRIYRQHIRNVQFRETRTFSSSAVVVERFTIQVSMLAILERYGLEVMTYNDARHILTTIAAQHCSKDDQVIIHKMLTHTPSTADKRYIEVSNMIMPHRREIPIRETLQRKLANKHHAKVSFFLKKSLEIQTRQSSTEEHNHRPETPTSPSSLSGESAGFEEETKTNM